MKTLAIVIAAAALSAACAPAQTLIYQQFIGDSVEMTTMTPSMAVGEGNKQQQYFSIHKRICTVQPNGEYTDCKETLVLDDTYPGSVY